MPIYQYQSLDSAGKKRTGMIEGQNERDARERLREKGLMVTKLTSKSSTSSRQNLKGEHLLGFTILLGQLLNAGIPLYESLVTIEDEYHQEPFHRVIMSLCEQVKSGSSLSQAMGHFPESFDRLYRAMIEAGEAAGALPVILERLTQLLSKQNQLKKKIGTAMIYPIVLATFALLVIALMLGFVVPSIEAIFAERQLNGFTEFVLSLSRFVRTWWWVYMPLIIGTGVWGFFKLRSPEGKLWMEKVLLKTPFMRTLLIQTAISRFCRTMGTLQQGGVSMIDSLRLAREVMQNATLEEEIKAAEVKIIEGSSLSSELGRSRLIPQMVPRMLGVGEEAGSLVTMLNKVAEIYEEEMEKSLDRVMALAQPIILIVMGIIIGMVLVAILLPLTDVSSFASGG